jgi:membrane-associated protease RseP (regulator of RpoE activity)
VDAAPPPPLTPAAWLMNNAIYLIIVGALVGVIWYKLGLDSVWYVAKVLLGLGFVIFIHELGHFLTAKWCDVHVQTFSIGFGPALPGCSFQRGETTYKIGVLPLGGYVNMIGEGPEADEDENYPRSFKNKTVGQRMLIISAGVIMNVLLGCVLFIAVYFYHGVEQPPAIVGQVDPASPMWLKGVPTGSLITDLDGVKDPSFKALRIKVVLSSEGEKLPCTFIPFRPDGVKVDERTVDLLPRLDENDPHPMVGVLPSHQLRLVPKQPVGLPVTRGSPALAARPVPVGADEVLIAATDPDDPDTVKEIKHDLKAGTFDYQDFSRRLRRLEGKKLVIHVLPKDADEKAKPIEREVPLEGFQFNDTIIGCTKEQTNHGAGYDPFLVEELPRDPRHVSGERRDPFAFHDRLRRLAGLPMIVQVRRGDPNNTSLRGEPASGPVVNLFVPPAYHVTFGMRMKMGKVAGVREKSPAADAGLRKGDLLEKVVLTDEEGNILHSSEEIDPERLPDQLSRAAANAPGKKNVVLTVRREGETKSIVCEPVAWEEHWDNDQEVPLSPSSPLAIPQLGLAYWVHSQIVDIAKGSPADGAGLKADPKDRDTITHIRWKERSEFQKEPDWSKWLSLETKRNGATQPDRWAGIFHYLQSNDYREIEVKVNRGGEELPSKALTAREDPDWPLVSRGLRLLGDYKLQKADNFGQALALGGRETRDWIGIMYLQLKSLLTGRVSFKNVSGPLGMMQQAFYVAQSGNFELLLFLAIISINLAVVNFLPIPVLDGGHMVFLIYEKLRGRPPSENVKVVATYIGLAMILLLMVVVFFQDFRKVFGI